MHLVKSVHDGKVYAMKILNKWEMLKRQDVRRRCACWLPRGTQHVRS